MQRNEQQLLRLRKKHGDGREVDVTVADGERLVRTQSMRNAIVAGLGAIVLFCFLWMGLASLTRRVFPWLTVILGALIGVAIQRAGRGVDWRFPVLAAAMAIAGSVISNIVVAASVTAESFGAGTLQVLRAVTSMTWPVFFAEVWGIADSFYAVVAAGFAAFFANRRLSRREFHALRLWRRRSDGHQ